MVPRSACIALCIEWRKSTRVHPSPSTLLTFVLTSLPVSNEQATLSNDSSDYIELLLADSNLPTGSFVCSSGLESMVQHGLLPSSSDDIMSFVERELQAYARLSIPFVNDAHRISSHIDSVATSLELLKRLDVLHEACMLSDIAKRASRAQGVALMTLYARSFMSPASSRPVDELINALRALGRVQTNPFESHLAICFGVVTAALRLPSGRAVHLFLFLHARSILSAAVRLNLMGPYLAQQQLWLNVRRCIVQVHQAVNQLSATSSEDAEKPATIWPLQEIVSTRMSNDFDVFRAASEGNTGLLRVALSSHASLAHKRDPDAVDCSLLLFHDRLPMTVQSNRTALHQAAAFGHLDAVQLLLEHGSEVDAKDDMGFTPLISAVSAGSSAVIRALLGAGASVSTATAKGLTPLHYAASKNRPEIGRLLIERGADINARDSANQLPLHRAASVGATQFVQLLTRKAEPGDTAAVKPRLNLADRAGSTPLHLAVESLNGETAVALIEAGADRTRTNADGQIAEDTSMDMERRRVTDYIVSKCGPVPE